MKRLKVTTMARNKSKKKKGPTYMMFNVHYENGDVTSNRRVSSELLDQTFGDALEDLDRTALEDQDNEIAYRSGTRCMPRG